MDKVIKSGMPVITSTPMAGVDKAAAAQAEKEKQLRKSCAGFEAIFTYHLLKSMRDTVPSSGLVDKFPGKETYNMMMDQKIAEELSQRGNGLGIKEMLYRQLAGKVLKDSPTVTRVASEKGAPDILSPPGD
jgi:peptidoglycan hydrolase FlgJ